MLMFTQLNLMGCLFLLIILFLFCLVSLTFMNSRVVSSECTYVTSQRKFHLTECSLVFVVRWLLI